MSDEPWPYERHSIPVDAPHMLSVAEYGDPKGAPVVFLHGGPGSGCRAASLSRLFDLKRFRVVAPDQRGAGESAPKGRLEDNTTQHLIADLETVREQLGIDRWLVAGGSWGALLAVAYAQAHPRHVAGLVVRSFFFGDDAAMRRAFIETPRLFYPELYERFVGFLDEDERAEPLSAYYRRLLSPDAAVHAPAAFMWHDYERALSVLNPGSVALPPDSSPDSPTGRPLPNTPRVEAHYFSRNSFLEPGELIDKAERLRGIRGVIVQGRYDLLCPPRAAYELLRHWPDAELVVVDAAGHSQTEPGVEEAMRDATRRLADEAEF